MEHTYAVTTWLKLSKDMAEEWQGNRWTDRQTDRTETQGLAESLRFVHVYYLLEKEEIKPPSHQAEEFPLKKK